jgi:imidazolonepropionase-like amidohydrolase
MLKKLLIAAALAGVLFVISGWLVLSVFIYRAGDPQSGPLALVNGRFYTMVGHEPVVREGDALLIEDGVITGFAPEGELPDDVPRVDLRGGTALPGLFDAHVHLGGVPMAEELGMTRTMLEYVQRFPRSRRKFLAWGVTTVVSLGDGHPQTVVLRDEIASGRLAGPRLLVAGPMLTSPGGHPVSTIFAGNQMAIEYATRQLDDPAEARTEVDRLAEAGVDVVKVIYTAGRDDTLPRMRYDVLEAIVEQAHARGLAVMVHTDTGTDVEDALRAGADGLAHLALGLGDDLGPLASRAEARGVRLVPTLAVMEAHLGGERMAAVLGEFAEWARHDVRVVLGTDAGNLPAGESVYAELALLVRGGMEPYDAFRAATINAARHFGLGDVLGTLEPGKRADVVVFEADPLEAIPAGPPAMVFMEGRLVADAGS